MKGRRLRFLAALLAVALLGAAAGCRSGRTDGKKPDGPAAVSKPSAPASPGELPIEERVEAYARFSAGVSYDLNDQPDLAEKEYYKSALADPGNEQLILELARRFLSRKEIDRAVELLARSAGRKDASGNILALQSRAFLQAGKTNQAIAAGQSAIRRDPGSATGYQSLLEAYLGAGQSREAARVLEQAGGQKQADAVFLITVGELYDAYLRAYPAEREALKPQVTAVLERAAQLKPRNPNLRQKLADQFFALGESQRAAELYLDLLSEYAELPILRDMLRERLANVYLQGSDRARAAEQLEAIVRDNPTRYPQAYYYLGQLAYDGTNYDKASEYFKKALLFNPNLEAAYYDLAVAQMNLQQPGEAIKTLDKARERFPQSFAGEFFTGLAYGRMKNYADAMQHFITAEVIATAVDPKRLNHLLYYHLGATSERKGDIETAEKYFQKCLTLSPDFAEGLNYLGYMWAERGEHLEKAREMIERAVKLEPKNAAFLDSLAWVHFKLKQPDDALNYVLQAVELSGEPDPTLLDHLGDIYTALKRPEKAREAWQKSLKLEPNEVIQKKLDVPRSSLQ